MRCPTCSDTAHPGFIVWREVEVRDGVYRHTFCPCPDCGGSAMTSCDDGIVETWRDATNARDTELVDEISAAPGVRLRKGKS
jgi:hypothetical protein